MGTKGVFFPRVKVRRVDKTYADFSIANVTNTITLYSLPAKAQVIGVVMVTTTAPDDGAGPMAHYDIEVGDALGAGDVNSFITSTETYGVAANTIADTRGVRLTTTQGMLSTTAATNITATATSDVNLNTATQGAWSFYIAYVQEF